MSRLHMLLGCLALPASLALAQDAASPLSQAQEIEKARAALDVLATSHTRLDAHLLEPVADLANRLLQQGEYDEAHVLLDQAAQISRVVDGLYTMNQVPFLMSKAGNYANRNDWFHAEEQLDHLYWLLSREENIVDDDLIANLLQLTDLHLRGIAEDIVANQAHHFRAAVGPNRLALGVAQRYWGENDPRLAPILYKLVQQYYLQSKAVEIGGRTSSALRTYTGTGLSKTRAESRMNNYYLGQILLLQIRDLFGNQPEPDIEGMALAELYLADWEVLFSNVEPALAAYERSFAGLQQAGIGPAELNTYFDAPVLLPAHQFYPTWSALVAANEPQTGAGDPSTVDAIVLRFQQRSPNLPFANSAPTGVALGEPDPDTTAAIFSFQLPGLEQIKLWNRGRLRTLVGTATNLRLLHRALPASLDAEALREEVLEMRFRPKLIDGIPQPVNATLRYELASSN